MKKKGILIVIIFLFFALSVSAQNKAPEGFVFIKGGTFTMGSPVNEPERSDDEVQHQVTVNSFYMGKYEVTQKEYKEIMGINPSEFRGDNRPVEMVNWYDAIEYCNKRSQKEGLNPAYTIDKSRKDPNNRSDKDNIKWIVTWNRNANGYRLPTEAEWEYACRAGTTTRFWSGNDEVSLQGKANVADLTLKDKMGEKLEEWVNIRDGYVATSPVGSFTANPWGLFDMHGNVSEWCWDWYDDYAAGAQSDPMGSVSGAFRVYRGGCFYNFYALLLRSAFRLCYNPDGRDFDLGFRLVRNQ